MSKSELPPAVILGGGANALSVVRSLGRAGVQTYAVNHPDAHVRYSRYCTLIPMPCRAPYEQEWAEFLTGSESDPVAGAVLLAASDAGIQLLCRHREALQTKFRLDDCSPAAQLCMLNKQCTYERAREAGVPTPRFWTAATVDEVAALEGELVYPLIVKPAYSHIFQERFNRKFLVVNSFDALLDAFREVRDAQIDALLVEMIPGPDTLLCSYYTYMDEGGEPAFDFTKRILRRYPVNMGGATYHITDWNPEVREVALKLFQHVGLRGLANAEFKRDERDGQLKLIECNARFTAGNPLVAAAGLDLALFVYNRLVGRPCELPHKYRVGLRLWDPGRDVKAYMDLRRRGELGFGGWLGSLAHRQVFQWFSADDPWPSVMSGVNLLSRRHSGGVRP